MGQTRVPEVGTVRDDDVVGNPLEELLERIFPLVEKGIVKLACCVVVLGGERWDEVADKHTTTGKEAGIGQDKNK